MRRKTYQFGWLETRTRADGTEVWVYRFREPQPKGGSKKRSVEIGTKEQYPTEALVWKRAEHLRLAANPENPTGEVVTFGALLDRYIAEELPELRHSTGHAYRSYIERHVRPKWGTYPIGSVKPCPVEQWLKSVDLAPKTKGQIHTVMRCAFNAAMRWELIEIGENPMRLVRVRGVSKRENEPRVLTIKEVHRLLECLTEEPFRTMVLLDVATGLRCSELFALKWCDFQWEALTVLVRRALVNGVVDDVKTRYSKAGLPLDPALAELVWAWKARTQFNRETDWVFASPAVAGLMPYWPWRLQQNRIKPAAQKAGLGDIGWHTFRHTFSSLLHANGENLKVQQELLRHADIRTTMNVYTHAMADEKRQAQSKIVRMLLPGSEVRSGVLPPSAP
jgi:integrase